MASQDREWKMEFGITLVGLLIKENVLLIIKHTYSLLQESYSRRKL